MNDFIEVPLSDGQVVRFPAGTSREEMAAALNKLPTAKPAQADPQNPDGSYGQPPEGMVLNPNTGQMTDRSLLANSYGMNRNISNAESAVGGFARGSTFGFNDEILGGVNAIIPGKGTASERYEFGREAARAQEDAQQAENPNFFLGGEIGGAGMSALTYGLPTSGLRSLAASGLGGRIGAGTIVGAGEGLTYGLGTGEGAADRMKNAAKYGTAGAALGAAVPIGMDAAKWTGRTIGDFTFGGIDAVTGRASQSRANRALARTLLKSGKTVDDLDSALSAASREGQPDFRAMDALGKPGQRRANALVRSGGDGAEEISDFLMQRQMDQGDRVISIVDEAMGSGGTTADKTRAALTTARDDAADVAYNAARGNARPVQMGDVADAFDDALRGVNSLDGGNTALAETAIGRKLANLRKQIASNQYSTVFFDDVLETKQELGRAIEAIKKGGRKVPPAVAKVYGALDDALEGASDMYRTANDEFRTASRVIDSVDEGKNIAMRGRYEDTVPRFQGMTPEQQAAARVGYGDTVVNEIQRNKATAPNTVRNLNSTKRRNELAAMSLDPARTAQSVGRENAMQTTFDTAMTGSRTADNLSDIADLNGVDAGPVLTLLSGQPKAAALQLGQRGINAATGMNQNTRQLIAWALLSNNADAWKTAMQQAANAREASAIYDAMIRAGAVQQSKPIQNSVSGLLK